MHSEKNNQPSYPVPASRNHFDSRPVRYVGDAPAAGSDGENLLSHTFILWVIRQWWVIVLPIGLVLASVAAAIVMYFFVPKYESTALLMIEDTTPFVAFSSQENRGQGDRYVQTQLEMLRSAVVLEPLLGRPEIAKMEELKRVDDRVKYVHDHLSIKQVGRSELYNISYISSSAQDAANVVNGLAAEYLNNRNEDESQRSQHVIDILEEERRRRGLEIERLRKRVVELAKEVTGRDPFGANEITDVNRALSPVGALFQSLTQADVDREVRRAELQSMLDASAQTEGKVNSSGLLDLEVESQDAVQKLQQGIKDVEARLEDSKKRAARFEKNPNWDANPDYVALKNDLLRRQKDLADTKAKIRDVILSQRKEKQSEEQTLLIAQMKRELQSVEARRTLLAKRFEEQVKEQQSGGGKSVELVFARSELDREEKVFELIASRKLALQTELRAPARVQLRQKANIASVPLESIPYKLLLLACSSSLALPFGLAVVREATVRRISDAEQLALESNLRVLGEVSALPVRYVAVSPNQLSGRLRRDTYIYAESIDSLRTSLALANGIDQQVLAVTSAMPSEGKTSVSVSLAMSISNATEEPTLIIDGDMRSPFVASMLKAKSQPGLFEVLSNKCSIEDAIQRVGKSELYVIPGGSATKSTHSVVGMTELKELLDKLRGRFKTIIIDTPPILGASESLVLAKAADAVLFCSLCNVSKAKQVRLAVDRLEHAKANVAGAVLSGTSARRYEYSYGYYANRLNVTE